MFSSTGCIPRNRRALIYEAFRHKIAANGVFLFHDSIDLSKTNWLYPPEPAYERSVKYFIDTLKSSDEMQVFDLPLCQRPDTGSGKSIGSNLRREIPIGTKLCSELNYDTDIRFVCGCWSDVTTNSMWLYLARVREKLHCCASPEWAASTTGWPVDENTLYCGLE